jgi:hypothetical protein
VEGSSLNGRTWQKTTLINLLLILQICEEGEFLAKIVSLKKKEICEVILRKNRLVTEEELQEAITKAKDTGEYLHQVVVDMGLADRTKVLEVLATE